jgi:uncharacterized 2Fe-2S/4Fe-4S cluster protein (DUF4445 family)
VTLVEEETFSAAELASGWRLACQGEPRSDVKVDVPPESLTTPQRLQIEGKIGATAVAPAVLAVDLMLPPPHRHDLRDDVTRLQAAWQDYTKTTADMTVPLAVLQTLSTRLRQHNWQVRLAVTVHSELVAVLPLDTELCGLAVDIGTTSIAVYLVALASGTILGKTGAMNPQIAYGEDVISRIVYCNERENGRTILQTHLIEVLNQLIASLCHQANLSSEQIVDVVVVGNTVMHHIFTGLPVQQLGEAPYLPAVTGALHFPARQVGLDTAVGAQVYLPPNIAGYVGADHTAMLLASGILNSHSTAMALDIGTNTEITLTHQGRYISCACASGPAFEGAHILAGMRAAPGAIERVRWQDGKALTQVIGERQAVGICGSGILDSIAMMMDIGLVDARGALQRTHPLIHSSETGKPVFVLVPAAKSGHGRDIIITRQDVAEIQLAKAAIRAGIDLLLAEAGIAADAIDQFIIAGAFGTYIHVTSAMRIGMFPPLPESRFAQIGNAAGMGAVLLLTSCKCRQQMEVFGGSVQYLDLTTHHDFQNSFVNRMKFDKSE